MAASCRRLQTADVNGQIAVFYETSAQLLRLIAVLWYDGVGYQVSAIPEPTSMAMIGLGCAGYLARTPIEEEASLVLKISYQDQMLRAASS